jgi:hypothetical protein
MMLSVLEPYSVDDRMINEHEAAERMITDRENRSTWRKFRIMATLCTVNPTLHDLESNSGRSDRNLDINLLSYGTAFAFNLWGKWQDDSQHFRSQGQKLNPATLKHEAGSVIARPWSCFCLRLVFSVSLTSPFFSSAWHFELCYIMSYGNSGLLYVYGEPERSSGSDSFILIKVFAKQYIRQSGQTMLWSRLEQGTGM